jgi:hypothetical protein
VSSSHEPQTLGEVARQLGVEQWQIRRVLKCGDIPATARIRHYRIFYPEDLPALVEALRRRGYLPEGVNNV